VVLEVAVVVRTVTITSGGRRFSVEQAFNMMAQTERGDSLDLMLNSTSLPAFASTELTDLLKLIKPEYQQQQHVQPQPLQEQQPLQSQSISFVQRQLQRQQRSMPIQRTPDPDRAPAPDRPPARFMSSPATTLAAAVTSTASMQTTSGGGGPTGPATMSTPFAANKISLTPNAQIFISDAPFVFRTGSAPGKEESSGSGIAGSGGRDDVGDRVTEHGGEVGEEGREVARRRVEARKERNRRAQRTFRQKQKARMGELETEVAELSARLERLQTSNASLSANVSLLQKVLQVREQQVLDLQRQEEEEEKQRCEDRMLAEAFPSSSPVTQLSIIFRDGQPVKLSQQFIRKMTPEQAHSIWMTYGQKIRDHIRTLDGPDPDPRVQDRVMQLTKEFLNVIVLYVQMNPENFMKVRSFADQSLPPNVDINEVLRVGVKSMNLDEVQKHAIVNKWRWLVREHCRNQQEIVEAEQHLKAGLVSTTIGVKLSDAYLHEHQLVQKIQELFQERHKLKLEYLYYIVCEVMNPMQESRMLASTFPVLPNSLSIAEILAQELGEIDSLPVHNTYDDYSAVAIPTFVSCSQDMVTESPN